MTILHYFLGFPPYRGGGLTRYVVDLMVAQKELGHEVVAFWPGSISLLRGKGTLVRRSPCVDIENFEMVNPLPVSLLYGVKNPYDFMNEKSLNYKSFERMLDSVSPRVLHIHTLMGLPLAYITNAKERGIRIVYTSHDYFGLCPLVNIVDKNGCFSEQCVGTKCAECNINAKSTAFLRIRNMKSLIWLKKLKTYLQ